jgi:hypothetical protein
LISESFNKGITDLQNCVSSIFRGFQLIINQPKEPPFKGKNQNNQHEMPLTGFVKIVDISQIFVKYR